MILSFRDLARNATPPTPTSSAAKIVRTGFFTLPATAAAKRENRSEAIRMVGSRFAVLAVAGVMFAMPAPAKAQTTKTSLPARRHSQGDDYGGGSDVGAYFSV